jgi:hypothetical protein
VLLVSQVNYLEHKNNTWKNLYVLPIPRWVPFLTKLLLAWLLLLAQLRILLRPGDGQWPFALRGYGRSLGLGLDLPTTAYEALIPVLKSFLASFAVVAIMYWAGLLAQINVWLVIVGLAGYASAFALLL